MIWGDHHAAWWIGEVASDPAYRDEVVPLALDALQPAARAVYLDLGCGEGQMMREVARAGATAIGCELLPELAARAGEAGPVVVGRLPDMSWVRPDSVDGAFIVLVLEHLEDIDGLFSAVATAVRPRGVLAAVVNHPAFTSPGSGPFIDPDDGEVLWRWGPYLAPGSSAEPAGAGTVVFHHRPLGALLTAAAEAGWCLEALLERGVGERRAAADPLLAGQVHIPRLLGVRWIRGAQRS